MKKQFSFIFLAIMLIWSVFPINAFAVEKEAKSQSVVPVLTKVVFNNCKMDEKFSPEIHDYGVTLVDNSKTPTLKSYSMIGSGKIFVTYKEDNGGSQIAIVVTVEYDGGSSVYNFTYENLPKVSKNSNADLSNITFKNGYLYSQISPKDTSYKVFVPNDLKTLVIYPATDDINAKCSGPQEFTISSDEPKIILTVTASDGTTKDYKFSIKRLELSGEELSNMSNDNIVALVQKEGNNLKTEHIVIGGSVFGGIIVLAILYTVSKRIAVKPFDDEEPEFFLKDEKNEVETPNGDTELSPDEKSETKNE